MNSSGEDDYNREEYSRRKSSIYKYYSQQLENSSIIVYDRVTSIKIDSNIYSKFKSFVRSRGLTVSYMLNLLMLSVIEGEVRLPNININITLNITKSKEESDKERLKERIKSLKVESEVRSIKERYVKVKRLFREASRNITRRLWSEEITIISNLVSSIVDDVEKLLKKDLNEEEIQELEQILNDVVEMKRTIESYYNMR